MFNGTSLKKKVNLHDLRLVDNIAEKSSRVVLISRTIIPSSTINGMQVGKNVNLRLLNNAPINKIKQGSRVVKKSWIPKEEMPRGTIVMMKTLRRDVFVQWDQIEESVNLHDIRLESNQHCTNREIEEGSRVVKIVLTSKEKSNVGTIVKVNITRQTARVRWDKQSEEKVQLYKLRLVGNYLTVCYMADEHNVSHIFSRIQSEDSKGKEMPARFDVKLTGYAFACGILEKSEVSASER
ncbi:unnamed protein product [Mytilus edulis]|uniref:Uncharacterized protein n=1 Tax=Mytilus edulis TaxID=6550 RepID=A0A8S3Q146_MYTED|nr:unnamed protein product [Mytilus edulis]